MEIADVRPKLSVVSLIYLAAVAMACWLLTTTGYITGVKQEYFGYVLPFNPFYMAFYSTYILGGIYFSVRTYFWGKNIYRRKQAGMIIIATIIPLIIGTFTDQIGSIGEVVFVPLALQTIMLTIGVVGYAILRYSPIEKVSVEQIAEAVTTALIDPIFLTDDKGVVNYANPAACRLYGSSFDEIIGVEISKIFPVIDKSETIMVNRKKQELKVVLKIWPVLGGYGHIYYARDLSPIFAMKESTQKMSQEIAVSLDREKKINNYLVQFLELTDVQKIDVLWDEIKYTAPDVEEIMQPVYKLIREYADIFQETVKTHEEVARKAEETIWLSNYLEGRQELLDKMEREYEELKNASL